MRVFRKLVPFENWRLEQHLLRLDGDDRRRRFSGTVPDEFLKLHCSRLDWLQSVVIGCFDAGVLRGAAELWLGRAPEARAELAITVERDWQGEGIGTDLLRRALVLARNRSARSLYMLCLLDNRRMQHIARKFEGSLSLLDGQAEADILVPFPTQLSLWQEAAADGLGLFGALLDSLRPEAAWASRSSGDTRLTGIQL